MAENRKRIISTNMLKTVRDFAGLLTGFITAYLPKVKCVKMKVLPVIRPTDTSQKLKQNS